MTKRKTIPDMPTTLPRHILLLPLLFFIGWTVAQGLQKTNHVLDLTTRTLTTSHLANREYTKDKSFGLDLSSSTTSLNRKNDTTYTKTKTLATLGQGTVTLTGTDAASKDALKQTNREITKVDKDIYHVERTQGNIDVTLDNRLLSEEGHKSIAEDIKRNEFLIESVADVVTKEAFEIGDTLDHIDEVQKDLTVQKQMALLEDGKYIRALGDGTPEQKQAALNQYAKIYADTYGISIEQAKVIATNKYLKGATHNQRGNNNIYINDNAQKNATDYAHTMGHEVTHARINQGVARDRGNHRLNEQYADTMGNYSADGMEFSNNTYTNNAKIDRHTTTNTHRGNRNSQLLKTNTQGFVDVVKRDGGNVDYSLSYEQQKALVESAANGDEVSQLEADEIEASNKAQKGVVDVVGEIVTDPKVGKELAKELSGYNDAKGAIEGLQNGEYLNAAFFASSVVLKPLKSGSKIAQKVKQLLKGKNPGTVTKVNGKVYSIDKQGHAVEVVGKPNGSNRTFVNNPKHGKTKRGQANPTPTNPQRALDNSIELSPNTNRRISVDKETGEYIIFDEHRPNEFHGHTRSWDELTPKMKAALRKAGLVTKKGKIK